MEGNMTFVPFSNNHFENDFEKYIKVRGKYNLINNFIRFTQELEGRHFNPKRVNQDISKWYGNNGLVRYEYPIQEGDSGIPMLHDMFKQIPIASFCEFFVNKRDFPIVRKDGNKPYTRMYGLVKVSEKYDTHNFSPVLSMVEHDDYSDIAIPTWYDWDQANPEKYFPRKGINFNFDFTKYAWKDKLEQVIFRGASTGQNLRIKACTLAFPWLNAGITKWNARPRLDLSKSPFLETIKKCGLSLVPEMSPDEQARFKYVLNIPGHVCAYRLTTELKMGSVVLLVECEYRLWFQKFLKPTDITTGFLGHYIPIKADFSNLETVYNWCITHDSECQKIIANAQAFYKEYLTKEGIITFLSSIIKTHCVCNYSYPEDPLTLQLIQEEKWVQQLLQSYPTGRCTNDNISVVRRNYKVISWIMHGTFMIDMKILKKNILYGDFKGVKVVCKQAANMHEPFIGLRYINKISAQIPNFMYTFTVDKKLIYTEFIPGQTFSEFIQSKAFSTNEFVSILLQLCMALSMAQKVCKFVHYDLYPWNVVLKRTSQTIQYGDIAIKTNLIPVIIDYGRSQAGNFGYSAPPLEELKYSPFQDILTFMVSSLSSILRAPYRSTRWCLIGRDKEIYLRLSNLISETRFTRHKKFERLADLKKFCYHEKNLSLLVTRPIDPILDKITPLDFFNRVVALKVPLTIKIEKGNMVRDLRRNSLCLFSNLCKQPYDICKNFLKKTLPLKGRSQVYNACLQTLNGHKENSLYPQCIKKLEKYIQIK